MEISKEETKTVVDGSGDVLFTFNKHGIKIDDPSNTANIIMRNFYIVVLRGSRLKMAIRAFITIWREAK